MDPKTVQPLVYIILLDYDGRDDTIECLESLRGLDYGNPRILLIDNGSRRSCLDEVRSRFPRVLTERIEPNRGFMGGCNVGIRAALDAGAEFVWLLNNDTIVDAKALAALVREAGRDPRCGILGSKIFYYGRRDTLHHAGGGFDDATGRLYHIGMDGPDDGTYDSVKEVYFVTGCSLLARAEMIREIGLLDESYVLYFDDIDWCVKAREKGWAVKYVPDSVLYHKVSRTTNQTKSPRYYYYYSRNYLLFFGKHFPSRLPAALGRWWRDYAWRFAREGNIAYMAASVAGMLAMWTAAARGALRTQGGERVERGERHPRSD